MDIWWDWVNKSLSELVPDPIIQQWAKNKLLPLVYAARKRADGRIKLENLTQ